VTGGFDTVGAGLTEVGLRATGAGFEMFCAAAVGLTELLEALIVLGFWVVTGLLGLILAISGFLALVTTGLVLVTVGLVLVFTGVLLVFALELTLLVVLDLLEVTGLV
jgi:hypothetical protein